MSSNTLQFILEAVDKTKAAFDSASKNTKDLQGKMESMKPAFQGMAAVGTASFLAIGSVIAFSVKQAADAQIQMAKVHTIFVNIGKTSKFTVEALDNIQYGFEQAGKAAVKLGFDDEAVTLSLSQLFQVTNNVEQATRANALAMDLSAAKGIDLDTATKAITLALAGNTKLLKLYNIELEDGASKTEILTALNEKFGGSALNASKTIEVQMRVFHETLNNLGQTIGEQFIPILTDLLKKIEPVVTKIIAWVEKNPELTRNILIAALAISGLVAVMGFLGLALPFIIGGFTLLLGPVGLVIAAIVALTAVGTYLYLNWSTLKDNMKAIWDGIKKAVGDACDWMMKKLQPLISAFDKVQGVAKKVGGAVGSVFGRASGGSVGPSRSFLVGEHGPELFTPSSFGSIGRAGGGAIVINITGNTFMGRERIAEQIGNEIMRTLQLRMRTQ